MLLPVGFYLTLVLLTTVSANAIRHHRQHHVESIRKSAPDPTQYLMEFGYLPMSDFETGALRTEQEYRRAIRQLQLFANLPPSGELDAQTISLMRRPRCGVVDVDRSSHLREKRQVKEIVGQNRIGPSKWHKSDLTYRIKHYPTSGRLTSAQTNRGIRKALETWGNVTRGLRFRKEDYQNADINVEFWKGFHHDGYSFDGNGKSTVLAHAFFPGEGRGGDIHFDDDEFWTYAEDEGTDFYSVALHEAGHALGLSHVSYHKSVMFPWHKPVKEDEELDVEDIRSIQYLYGNYLDNWPTDAPTWTTPSTTVRLAAREPANAPDTCSVKLDAITIIRGELFAFKDQWFWRIRDEKILDGYPVEIHRFWHGLPDDLSHVDAVLERPGDGRIMFFSGNRFWEFEANHLNSRFTQSGRPLTDLGLPSTIRQVDTAFVWGYNGRVYVIAETMYWRMDHSTRTTDFGYPHDMSIWSGVRLPVDAAVTHTDGKTYFFHGEQYWEFSDSHMRLRHLDPGHINDKWLECKNPRPVDIPSRSSHLFSMLYLCLSCQYFILLLHLLMR